MVFFTEDWGYFGPYNNNKIILSLVLAIKRTSKCTLLCLYYQLSKVSELLGSVVRKVDALFTRW